MWLYSKQPYMLTIGMTHYVVVLQTALDPDLTHSVMVLSKGAMSIPLASPTCESGYTFTPCIGAFYFPELDLLYDTLRK